MRRILGAMTKASGFQDVDRTAEAGAFVVYLDNVTALAAVQAYKRRILAALGLAPGMRALDVGCGTGDDVRAMAAVVGTGGHVVGVDVSEQLVAEARRRAAGGPANVEFRAGDAHTLPFADGSFDVVRTERVLQHVADPARVVAEMARLARPGGRVAAGEPDWETLVIDGSERSLVRRILNFRGDQTRHAWIGRRLPALFRDAGLADIGVSAETLMVSDWALADAMWELRTSAGAAARAGAVTADEAARFVADLERAAAAGRFFGAVTGFVAVGTRR
jgi:ubiquinone/menaquinone biosynthesis C-methylase UbiE